MFSSKYGKCQAGSISATPSAEMNRVEMTFAIVGSFRSRVSGGWTGPAPEPHRWTRIRRPRARRAARSPGGVEAFVQGADLGGQGRLRPVDHRVRHDLG